MKRLFVALLMACMILALVCVSSAAMSDYILTIEPADKSGAMPQKQFLGIIEELKMVEVGDTPELAFDKVLDTVRKHKIANDVSGKVAEIDAQIAELEARKKELLSTPKEELKIYDILITKDTIIYRRMLRVLFQETSIEKQFGIPVYCVMFKPETRGNMYGTKLIWAWMFGKWQK